ncbi:MAG: hypothetical protein GF398_01780 [Chitinivibrionales bacterium]|nr:hypothetical protein [Chitinivibrionales bacterium]
MTNSEGRLKSRVFLVAVVLSALNLCHADSEPFSKKIAIMPFGNSITGSFDFLPSYRYFLWKDCKEEGYSELINFVGSLCGVGDHGVSGVCGAPSFGLEGWDTDHSGWHGTYVWEIDELFSDQVTKRGVQIPDIILCHFGSNDMANELNVFVTAQHYRNGINMMRSFNSDVKILACKIAPIFQTDAISDSVEKFNDSLEMIFRDMSTDQSPIYCIDQYTGFPRQFIKADGIHPNFEGEKWIADHFKDTLLMILAEMALPQVSIISPVDKESLESGTPLLLEATAGNHYGIESVQFIVNHQSAGQASQAGGDTFSLDWMPPEAGVYEIKAVVIDSMGQKDTSDAIEIAVTLPLPTEELSIMAIQGSGFVSVHKGNLIKTSGIVTGYNKDSSCFWIQDATGDANVATSEGIEVDAEDIDGSFFRPEIGDEVIVVGLVQEWLSEAGAQPVTRINFADSVNILSSGNQLPTAIRTTGLPGGQNDVPLVTAISEQYEGMLLEIENAIAVAPTAENGDIGVLPPTNAVAGSGYYADAGVSIVEKRNGGVDYQPECIVIGNRLLQSDLQVHSGDTIQKLTGIVDYRDGVYKINPLPDSVTYTPRQSIPQSPISDRGDIGSFTVSTFNADNFFDTSNTSLKEDRVVDSAAYATRLQKLKVAIIGELVTPEILALQEIENDALIQELALVINDSIGSFYKAALLESSDPHGLDCGFLYDSSLMVLTDTFLLRGPLVDSAFGEESGNPTAEPLVGVFSFGPDQFAVVNMDLVDQAKDKPLFGAAWPQQRFSEAQRTKQAQAIRDWLNVVFANFVDPMLIVAGSVNDLAFMEPGESADPMSVLKGAGTTQEPAMLSAHDFIAGDTRYTDLVNARARHSCHILISQPLVPFAKGTDVLHFNTHYRHELSTNPETPARSSKYDAVEVRF